MHRRSKLLFLVTIILHLASCATLTSRHQIISIDSNPRNIEVIYEKDNKTTSIGKTPFFYQFRREGNLKIAAKNGSDIFPIKNDCSLRWLVVFLGNIPFAVISPLLGVSAFGFDLLSGNAWNCENNVSINLPNSINKNSHPPKCHRVFVVPPYHESKVDSFLLLEKWVKKARNKIHCHEFVDQKDVLKFHELLNIGLHKKFEFEKVEKHKIRKIGYKTGSSIFVALNINPDNRNKSEGITIEASYYDMHTGQEVFGPDYPKKVTVNAEGIAKKTEEKILNFAFEKLPNSFGYESRSLSFVEDNFQEQRSSKSTLPTQISSWTILSETSPEAYNEWDISLGLYPRFEFYHFDWTYKLDSMQDDFRWRLTHLMAAYEGRVTFFTALGQLSTGFGFGPMLTFSKPSIGESGLYLSTFFTILIRYSAHMTSQLFFYLDIASNSPVRTFTTNGFHSDTFSDLSIGLGYYFPDFFSKTKSLL